MIAVVRSVLSMPRLFTWVSELSAPPSLSLVLVYFLYILFCVGSSQILGYTIIL